jgi:DNA repair protein RecO (recombination protein O)
VLEKTQGIVLSTINYSDKYILAPIYTNTFGRVTYMIPKTKGKSTKVHKSLFSPMSILDLEVDHQLSRDIQRIREAHNAYPLFSIPTNIIKTSIVFFLSDFLNKVLKDTDEHEIIFKYLSQSIQVLEESQKGLANYHIVFILKLSRFLGFYPNFEDYDKGDIFDMLNGVFVKHQPLHKHFVNKNESETLALLARINYDNMHHFLLSRQDRTNIINRMLEYYRIHLHDFPALKSLDILHELF